MSSSPALPSFSLKTFLFAFFVATALPINAQAPISIELECTVTMTLNQKLQPGKLTLFYNIRLQDHLLIDNMGRRFIAEITDRNIEYAGDIERKIPSKNSVITYKETVYGNISRTTGQLNADHLAKDVNDPDSPPIRTQLTGSCVPVAPKF